MPVQANLGIQHDATTWSLALAVTFLWVISARLCFRSDRAGWQAIPLSLFGLAWIGFGVDYIMRFVVLSINSVTYGNETFRLANVPASGINLALMMVVLFWSTVCLGYLVAVRRRGAGPFAMWNRAGELLTTRKTDLLAGVSVAAILLSTRPWYPRALLTPTGLLGALWIASACMEWSRSEGSLQRQRGASVRRWLYLLPGLLSFYLSPYRERLIQLALVPFLAALFHGRRVRLATTVLGGVIFFLTATALIGTFREIAWGESSDNSRIGTWSDWMGDRARSPWGQALRRFHSLDSLILTVDLVPDVFPYQERNVFVEAAVRAFVPRAIYVEKADIARGRIFASTIWGYGDVSSNAMIAPSIVGDLYSLDGPIWVIIGGLAWGLLLGVVEGWKDMLKRPYGLLILMFLGVSFAQGLELDFAHAAATILQQLVLLVVVLTPLLPAKTGALPAARQIGDSPAFSPQESKWISGKVAKAR